MMLFPVLVILSLAILGALLWPARKNKAQCTIIIAVFFVGAFSLYALTGSPQLLPLLEAREERIEAVRTSMIKHSAIVKQDPNNLRSWVALGQAFVETGQWDAAANAFRRAVVLSEGDPKLIMAYAKAMILGADGTVSFEAKQSLDMVLLQQPMHEEARYYSAVYLLQQGDTENAMQMMRELYRSLDASSPLKAAIDEQIGRN